MEKIVVSSPVRKDWWSSFGALASLVSDGEEFALGRVRVTSVVESVQEMPHFCLTIILT